MLHYCSIPTGKRLSAITDRLNACNQLCELCASASPLGGQCHPSSPRVLHSLGLWPGRHSNLFVTLPTLPSGVRRTSILTAQRTISPLFTNTLLRGYRA